ncbi:MAG TPA: hypothetical protein VM052_08940 [Candidatus Limnocylindrales bacterium]|nr:hypothetical protein [Candidatus Limnocylindrales bacterium]
MTADADPIVARRAAVATICEGAARTTVDRVVEEAVRAASIFGLTRERATAYGEGIHSTLPPALAAMKLPDGPEREARITELGVAVRAVSESHHVPRIIERGLVMIAVRIAREVIRRRAEREGFTADELDAEFVSFADQLEERLFRGDAPA